jgi:hypothetical protein
MLLPNPFTCDIVEGGKVTFTFGLIDTMFDSPILTQLQYTYNGATTKYVIAPDVTPIDDFVFQYNDLTLVFDDIREMHVSFSELLEYFGTPISQEIVEYDDEYGNELRKCSLVFTDISLDLKQMQNTSTPDRWSYRSANALSDKVATGRGFYCGQTQLSVCNLLNNGQFHYDEWTDSGAKVWYLRKTDQDINSHYCDIILYWNSGTISKITIQYNDIS